MAQIQIDLKTKMLPLQKENTLSQKGKMGKMIGQVNSQR